MNKKIIVIGSGAVGASFSYALTLLDVGDSVGIIDINKKKALGDVLDLKDADVHTASNKIFLADYEDCKDAKVVVITAGIPQKPGETRLELLNKNLNLMKEITSNVMKSGFKGIFLIATNPVDVMSYACYKFSGLSKNQVIGSGTVLDTSRLQSELSNHLNIDPKNVHAYILGEHGDSEFAIWSNSYISAIPLKEWLQRKGINEEVFLPFIEESVRNKAYNIIDLKGATYYGIGMSLTKIVEAILNDSNTILTVSAYLEGEFRQEDIFIGVPAIINKDGIKEVIDLKLTSEESLKMNESAKIIKEQIRKFF